MHLHTCPRCRREFNAPVKIDGMQCRPCIEKRDPLPREMFEDSTPTRPMLIVPIDLRAYAQ